MEKQTLKATTNPESSSCKEAIKGNWILEDQADVQALLFDVDVERINIIVLRIKWESSVSGEVKKKQ